MPATETLTSRREFLFLYDIRMGNPNGDPDENRPRVLPDHTHYVTDVRLKRFARDYFKITGRDILVDSIEGRTTNLTGRVAAYLAAQGIPQVTTAAETVRILLDSFIDARLFGSTFAFKTEKVKGESGDENQSDGEEEPSGKKAKGSKGDKGKKPRGEKAVKGVTKVGNEDRTVLWAQPDTLTGPVQILHGEVKHKAQEVDIYGTSTFGSDEEKGRGTFTNYFGLRYALIAFNGVANQHSAKVSRMTDADYDELLKALWNGVRSAANTRTKRGQVPRLLVSVEYHPGQEFQFGNLTDYVQLVSPAGKPEKEWASPADYTIDLSVLAMRLRSQSKRIARVRYCLSPDVTASPALGELVAGAVDMNLDEYPAGGE